MPCSSLSSCVSVNKAQIVVVSRVVASALRSNSFNVVVYNAPFWSPDRSVSNVHSCHSKRCQISHFQLSKTRYERESSNHLYYVILLSSFQSQPIKCNTKQITKWPDRQCLKCINYRDEAIFAGSLFFQSELLTDWKLD